MEGSYRHCRQSKWSLFHMPLLPYPGWVTQLMNTWPPSVRVGMVPSGTQPKCWFSPLIFLCTSALRCPCQTLSLCGPAAADTWHTTETPWQNQPWGRWVAPPAVLDQCTDGPSGPVLNSGRVSADFCGQYAPICSHCEAHHALRSMCPSPKRTTRDWLWCRSPSPPLVDRASVCLPVELCASVFLWLTVCVGCGEMRSEITVFGGEHELQALNRGLRWALGIPNSWIMEKRGKKTINKRVSISQTCGCKHLPQSNKDDQYDRVVHIIRVRLYLVQIVLLS